LATPGEVTERVELPALMRRSGGYGLWAAVEKATGEFVGWFHMCPRDDGAADAPTELGAQRVWAEAMLVHTASRRVMEKAGLKYVRTFHADWPYKIEGDEEGDVEYALDRHGRGAVEMGGGVGRRRAGVLRDGAAGGRDARFPGAIRGPDQVFAGGVANRSETVVGLSNMNGDLESAYRGAAGAVQKPWGAMPVVGYDSGAALEAALRFGFAGIAELAVWAR
jgi:hypothetical protein